MFHCIRSFHRLYEDEPLQYVCLVKIAISLMKVDDIEELPILEHLKAKLRSEPIVLLIGAPKVALRK